LIVLYTRERYAVDKKFNGNQCFIASLPRRSLHRLFCLVCGKVPKQPNATPFYEVETATLPTANAEKNFTSLSKKLREVIKISDAQRNQLVPSKDVCKKCFRSLVDMEFMENQVKILSFSEDFRCMMLIFQFKIRTIFLTNIFLDTKSERGDDGKLSSNSY